MRVFPGRGGYISKFQHRGKQHWTPGGPWKAQEAERRYRDRLAARRTEETCASFAEGVAAFGRIHPPALRAGRRALCQGVRPHSS